MEADEFRNNCLWLMFYLLYKFLFHERRALVSMKCNYLREIIIVNCFIFEPLNNKTKYMRRKLFPKWWKIKFRSLVVNRSTLEIQLNKSVYSMRPFSRFSFSSSFQGRNTLLQSFHTIVWQSQLYLWVYFYMKPNCFSFWTMDFDSSYTHIERERKRASEKWFAIIWNMKWNTEPTIIIHHHNYLRMMIVVNLYPNKVSLTLWKVIFSGATKLIDNDIFFRPFFT